MFVCVMLWLFEVRGRMGDENVPRTYIICGHKSDFTSEVKQSPKGTWSAWSARSDIYTWCPIVLAKTTPVTCMKRLGKGTVTVFMYLHSNQSWEFIIEIF